MNGILRRISAVLLGASTLFLSPPVQAAPTLPPTVELRQIGEVMVPFQSGLPLPTYEPQMRPKMELSEGWRAARLAMNHALSLAPRTPATRQALEREGKGWQRPEFDDRAWADTTLPSVANPPPRADGSGIWYRRRVTLPAGWQGKRILLHCLAANYLADVWVNGAYIGYHEGGFTPFTFDITEALRGGRDGQTEALRGGATGLLAIRVDNPPWSAGVGNDLSRALLPGSACDWWNATGILRDIYLEAVPPVSLVRSDLHAEAAAEGTLVKATSVVRNAAGRPFTGRLTLTVYPTRVTDATLGAVGAEDIARLREPVSVVDGRSTAEFSIGGDTVLAWTDEFTVKALARWSPSQPRLYVLEAALRDEQGRLVDRLLTQFGVRSLLRDPYAARLLLNEKPIYLAGVARVEDDPRTGRAMSYADSQRLLVDLRSVRRMGGNFVRLGRGPNHPLSAIYADRLGLLCWEEIPAAWMESEAMQRQWEERHLARQTFIEMMYQDYNRPSVGFWGVGHALGLGAIHQQFVRDLVDMGHFLDGTRLIGETAPLDERSPLQTETDVVGYALDPSQGANPEALADALVVLDQRRRTMPTKPVLITEFGAVAGGDDRAWDRQVVAAQDMMRVFAARPFVVGCAWWSLADYLSPAGTRRTGLLSRDRRTTRPVAEVLADSFGGFQRRGEANGSTE